MTSLKTTLPELDELMPRVRGQVADVLDRRERVRRAAASAMATLSDRAAAARELLEAVRDAALGLDAQADGELASLDTSLAALAAAVRAQVQAIEAAVADVAEALDAVEANGSTLTGQLALVPADTAAAWELVDRGTASLRADLQAQATEMATLAEEARALAEALVARTAGKQQELAAEAAQARISLQSELALRSAELAGAAAEATEGARLLEAELGECTAQSLEGPGGTLVDLLAQRLAEDVVDPAGEAVAAALLAIDQAGLDQRTTAAELGARQGPLAEAGRRAQALLPASAAHVDAARVAAGQVNVDWRL